jgi:hypothetical protein
MIIAAKDLAGAVGPESSLTVLNVTPDNSPAGSYAHRRALFLSGQSKERKKRRW